MTMLQCKYPNEKCWTQCPEWDNCEDTQKKNTGRFPLIYTLLVIGIGAELIRELIKWIGGL
jgi:hypothetical protein